LQPIHGTGDRGDSGVSKKEIPEDFLAPGTEKGWRFDKEWKFISAKLPKIVQSAKSPIVS
jgi:hypothetical protein